MTEEEVRSAVEEIRSIKGDDEAAHSAEDGLWQRVLEAIAQGAPNARELAAEALKTCELSFARWCA